MSHRKIVLLGANGQVGFELARSLLPLGEVTALSRQQWDLQDLEAGPALLDKLRPDVLVNAAAYTAVDKAESEPELANAINAKLPALLARHCVDNDALLVHYSTDYVFAGDADRPYLESDDCAPTGVYGESKLAGERAISDSGCEHLVFRTSWVFAERGHNFLQTMLRLATQRDALSIVSDQQGCPTWSRHIADTTAAILAQRGRASGPVGTFHLASRNHTNWHAFADAIFDRAVKLGLIPKKPELTAIGTHQYPTPAKRPAWSVLDTDAIERAFSLRMPTWQKALELCMGRMVS
ncbi:MAG: NAD(P)-dependent oxidoreductase [Lysobacteraceae bacterium]|nr:MAG: NAD(P)-dependent oxidoreductase [Xanthomonadaceae bacterium]